MCFKYVKHPYQIKGMGNKIPLGTAPLACGNTDGHLPIGYLRGIMCHDEYSMRLLTCYHYHE